MKRYLDLLDNPLIGYPVFIALALAVYLWVMT
jgi:hypothetical protein